MDEPSKQMIPCINPGLSCCEHRLLATGRVMANVAGHPVWCGKWRENRMKDKVFRACQPDYLIKESAAIIDAEAQQRDQLRQRSGK